MNKTVAIACTVVAVTVVAEKIRVRRADKREVQNFEETVTTVNHMLSNLNGRTITSPIAL
jgi:hypothetical protein